MYLDQGCPTGCPQQNIRINCLINFILLVCKRTILLKTGFRYSAILFFQRQKRLNFMFFPRFKTNNFVLKIAKNTIRENLSREFDEQECSAQIRPARIHPHVRLIKSQVNMTDDQTIARYRRWSFDCIFRN